jgi:hypothetical protein
LIPQYCRILDIIRGGELPVKYYITTALQIPLNVNVSRRFFFGYDVDAKHQGVAFAKSKIFSDAGSAPSNDTLRSESRNVDLVFNNHSHIINELDSKTLDGIPGPNKARKQETFRTIRGADVAMFNTLQPEKMNDKKPYTDMTHLSTFYDTVADLLMQTRPMNFTSCLDNVTATNSYNYGGEYFTTTIRSDEMNLVLTCMHKKPIDAATAMAMGNMCLYFNTENEGATVTIVGRTSTPQMNDGIPVVANVHHLSRPKYYIFVEDKTVSWRAARGDVEEQNLEATFVDSKFSIICCIEVINAAGSRPIIGCGMLLCSLQKTVTDGYAVEFSSETGTIIETKETALIGGLSLIRSNHVKETRNTTRYYYPNRYDTHLYEYLYIFADTYGPYREILLGSPNSVILLNENKTVLPLEAFHMAANSKKYNKYGNAESIPLEQIFLKKYLLYNSQQAENIRKDIFYKKYLLYDGSKTLRPSLDKYESKYLLYGESEAPHPKLDKDAKHLYLKYKNKYLQLKNSNHKLLTNLDLSKMTNKELEEKYRKYKNKYLMYKNSF